MPVTPGEDKTQQPASNHANLPKFYPAAAENIEKGIAENPEAEEEAVTDNPETKDSLGGKPEADEPEISIAETNEPEISTAETDGPERDVSETDTPELGDPVTKKPEKHHCSVVEQSKAEKFKDFILRNIENPNIAEDLERFSPSYIFGFDETFRSEERDDLEIEEQDADEFIDASPVQFGKYDAFWFSF